MDRSAYVTIGRNVKGVPMRGEKWEAYRSSLRLLAHRYGRIITRAQGVGVWKGRTEETYLIVFILPPVIGQVARQVLTLRQDLAELARDYQQDSIALLVGVPEFVQAKGV